MLFNSYEFIFLFLPITVIVFFSLGRHGNHTAALCWLILSSMFFYGWWNPNYLILICFSILFNFSVGRLLKRVIMQSYSSKATYILSFGIIINLGLISYFKYADFFIESINLVADTKWELVNVILPIGISFFTFQQIAYLVDVRREEIVEHNFLQYSIFVLFFPQLIAGPIVHHMQMLPQFVLARTYTPQVRNIAIGGSIFCIGLFKKVVIADTFGEIATPIFEIAETGKNLNFYTAWLGTFSYTLQLYFDFSGYSDMAIGLARLFGILLPLNFNSPYRATSIIEFWRFWHMTLSQFLRDYVYIPLGGNRHGCIRRYTNLMITMLIGGLWHGAGWTFIFWGGLHGLYLIINYAWRKLWKSRSNCWWGKCTARTITFISVSISWVFFRAESFDGALVMLDAMRSLPSSLSTQAGFPAQFFSVIGFRFIGSDLSYDQLLSILWLPFWMTFLWVLPNTQQWFGWYHPVDQFSIDSQHQKEIPLLLRSMPSLFWRPSFIWGSVIGLLFAVSIMRLSRVSEFLYFQF